MKLAEIICQKNAWFLKSNGGKNHDPAKHGLLSAVFKVFNTAGYPISYSHGGFSVLFNADCDNISFTGASRKK
jgi:hypothetical protein